MTAAPIGADLLSRAEVIALSDCEQRIEQGMKTYIEVGMALGAIRENRLYRAQHDTFEEYCATRWGFTGRRGRQLIEAAEIGNMFPIENSRQAAALAAVPEPQRAEVLAEAAERTGGKPTAKAISEVAAERTQSPGPVDAAVTPPAVPGSTPEPTDVQRAELAAAIPVILADGPRAVLEIWAKSPRGTHSSWVEPALRALEEDGQVEPAGRALRGNRMEPLWQLAEEPAAECLGVDMDCGRPLPCPNHPRTPEERLAAVAEVAPEFVKPAEPAAAPPPSKFALTPQQRREIADEGDRIRMVDNARRKAGRLVREVSGLITEIEAGVLLGEPDLITADMVAGLRAEADRLERILKERA